MTDCPRFDACSAPICPMSADSLRDCAWFPDEETCSLAQYRGSVMVSRQRKIARVTGSNPEAGCFTASMLQHPCVIGRGMRGLDAETAVTEKRALAWVAGRAKTRKGTPPRRPFGGQKGLRAGAGVEAAPEVVELVEEVQEA